MTLGKRDVVPDAKCCGAYRVARSASAALRLALLILIGAPHPPIDGAELQLGMDAPWQQRVALSFPLSEVQGVSTKLD